MGSDRPHPRNAADRLPDGSGQYIEGLNFLEILFGDEPALEPHERLYQRVLGGRRHRGHRSGGAEHKEMPLTEYYDQIAMRALSMAYEDARSGRLSREEIHGSKGCDRDVVDGLSDHALSVKANAKDADEKSVVAEKDAQVLCLPVRSELDEGPLLMFGQILEEHGIRAETLPYKGSIRAHSMEGLPQAANIIVFGFLGSRKLPAFLSILIRRVRTLVPDAVVVLGLWSLQDNPQLAEKWRQAAGADRVVSKLEDAAALCDELLNTEQLPALQANIA